MSLDYVVEDKMTRIAGNVGTNVFFDRDMEYIVYNSDAKLYVWHNGEITCAGEYQDVKAVEYHKMRKGITMQVKIGMIAAILCLGSCRRVRL